MITQICKIEKYQFFKNFSWSDGVPNFNKNNLIYGWNGTGKTTFANFLRQIEKKELEPDCGEFEILTDTEKITKDNFLHSNLKLKVFNQEYVKNTIFKSTNDIDPIFIIGEENISKKKIIDEKKNEIIRLENERNAIIENQERVKKELEKLCRNTARTIKDNLRPSELNHYKNYECPELREKIKILKNTTFEDNILSQEELNRLTITIKENLKPVLPTITLNYLQINEIETEVIDILRERIVTHAIARLKENNELNQWVHRGLQISKSGGTGVCPFCEQNLPIGYIENLQEHFNDTYVNVIDKIDREIQKIKKFKLEIGIQLPDNARFYDDLSQSYLILSQKFEQVKIEILIYLDKLVDVLIEKQKNPFKIVDFQTAKPSNEIINILDQINVTISEHNNRTTNFSKEIESAGNLLETHFAAEIINENLDLERNLNSLSEQRESLTTNIEKNKTEINELEKDLFTHALAADLINEDLHNFLNRNEIELIVKDKGYQISRKGAVIDRLSEGEKSAISFIYFLNSFNDNRFTISNSTIVIDDPISSFDSISLYNAFSYMINRTKNAQQIIILTHNYSFFNQVKNFLKDKKRIGTSRFYMIKNRIKNNERIAELHCLDEFLLSYSSEYHYLFSLIYKNAIKPDSTFEDYYQLPNLSRRFLESFLAFRFPSEIGNLGNQLSKSNIRPEQRTRILRYTNAHSHNDHIQVDSTGTILYLDETPQVLNDILDLVKTDNEHFNEMKKIMESTDRILHVT
jgi:wobble nucleotide-excising tRNase